MSKRIWSAVALGLAAMALVATGCSDSNDGNNPLNPGNLNDPDFQFVEQNIFDGAFDGIDVTFELSAMLMDSIPGAAPTRPWVNAEAAIDGDFYLTSYSYNYINDWHVFQVGGYITDGFSGDTVDFTGTDSMQLIADGAPVQVPDSTMEGFDYRVHFDAWSRQSSDSLSGHHQMQIRLVDQTLIETRRGAGYLIP